MHGEQSITLNSGQVNSPGVNTDSMTGVGDFVVWVSVTVGVLILMAKKAATKIINNAAESITIN